VRGREGQEEKFKFKAKVKGYGAALRGQPRAAVPTYELVAAGVVLRGDQDQARTARFRLLLGLAAERVQDADNGGICGENAQANGCDDGGEEEDGHYERDHDRPTLENPRVCCASPILTSYCLSANSLNLTCRSSQSNLR